MLAVTVVLLPCGGCELRMAQQHRSFPFRWVLPSVELVVCLALLWPARGLLFLGVVESIDSYSRPTPKSSVVPAPPVTAEGQRIDDAATRFADIRTKAPLALNFPVLVMQLPYILVSPAKRERIPKGMPPDIWRALSWPFVGILFWWFLGRGVEALLTARRAVVHPRISWVETAFALILLVTGLVAFIGVLTTTPDFCSGGLRSGTPRRKPLRPHRHNFAVPRNFTT